MNIQETSKFISLILRHKPETIGITLDEHGWANVDELIAGISKTHELNREMLEEIVVPITSIVTHLMKIRLLSEPTRDIRYRLM